MSKVFIVTQGAYSLYHIVGVFSTEERAQACVNNAGHDAQVEPFDLDGMGDIRLTRRWYVSVWLSDGSMDQRREADIELKPSGYRGESGIGHWYVGQSSGPSYAWGISPESPDHALKLAAEARQAWLRERAVAHE